MTEDQFANLCQGDVVRAQRSFGAETYVVMERKEHVVVAVRTAVLTDPQEWDLILKARHSRPPRP